MHFGLIGEKLGYSFSKDYFETKFAKQNLAHSYSNFELESIEDFPEIMLKTPGLKGLNVTIPYKQKIIPYLDQIDPVAKIIGAVNTIQFKDTKLIGHNTDVYGFEKSLDSFWNSNTKKALILGTGGASMAIAYVLRKMNVSFQKVSRKPKENELSYEEASEKLIEVSLIINSTPVGTFPEIENQPPLSLERVTKKHHFYDLIYNPLESKLLSRAKSKGAKIKNGMEMLELQADKSWDLWNEF
tara:strand:- start:742 stop:1467 length:726 start_codon:yes stop_codon:yes gene_type:complete